MNKSPFRRAASAARRALLALRPLRSRRGQTFRETRPMLTATNLHKTYRRHTTLVPVLRGLDLGVHPSEFLSVIGASGSGKSTLLHLLGTLDRPDDGEIRLDGQRIDDLPGRQRDDLRNRTFGFI